MLRTASAHRIEGHIVAPRHKSCCPPPPKKNDVIGRDFSSNVGTSSGDIKFIVLKFVQNRLLLLSDSYFSFILLSREVEAILN